MRVIIRADGGISLGMGHITRCLALAEMIHSEFTVFFALQQPEESILTMIHSVTTNLIVLPQTKDYMEDCKNLIKVLNPTDIVVLDGYEFKTDYQRAIKAKGCKVVAIDDLHAWPQVADAVINHASGIKREDYISESTSFYLGNDHILLRKSFLTNNQSDKKITGIKKVFVSMGAADVNNLTLRYAEALTQVKGIEEIHLMLGAINPHKKSLEELSAQKKHVLIYFHINISSTEICKILTECDLSICPASSISLESCAIGIGLMSGYTAENQRGILSGLKEHKAAIDLADMNLISESALMEHLNAVVKNSTILNDQLLHQKKMIDGRSPERILQLFRKLNLQKIRFRKATETDVDLYYQWANDSVVRKNSYSNESIPYADHVNWFQSKLKSATCSFYLFLNDADQAIGQVRIEKKTNETIIGISIDETFRGRSYGSSMLQEACNDYFQKNKTALISAYIKFENKASYSIFKKAGFANEEIVVENGFRSYKLNKTPDL